jgi:MATE family, multidrug efflux pump
MIVATVLLSLIGTIRGEFQTFRHEIRPMTRLAVPIVLANLGWMTMGIVDTIMVGRVSAEAIGAVSLASILFITVGAFGGGVMLSLDTLVSQAFGAGDVKDCHHSLLSSLYLSLPLSALLMGFLWWSAPLLGRFGINPAVFRQTVPCLHVLTWCTPPLLAYFAFRSYLQGMNLARPVTFALVSANVLNAVCDYALVYGHWGAPAMGAVGSAWSTTISRLYMAAVLAAFILYNDRREKTELLKTALEPDLARIRRLLGLGLPAATQIIVEIAVFALATALIGRLDAVSLAANQIALNTVSFTFMVPLGIGSAAAVRVGQALGRKDPEAAGHSGWAAMLLGAGFMSAAALALLLAPGVIARVYSPDPAVIRASASLLFVGAFFQLFDGLQTVATGALRGAGDTRTPMICHAVLYWLVGLPLGSFLCFREGWGAKGLWIGLSLALILIGCTLLWMWKRCVRTFVGAAAKEVGTGAALPSSE